MKRFYLYLLVYCLVGILYPLAWADVTWNGYKDSAGTVSLLESALNGRVVVRLYLPNSLEPKRSFYEEEIRTHFNKWFTQSARHIERLHRQMEFADIYLKLKTGFQVEFTKNASQASLFIYIVSEDKILKECGPNAGACAAIFQYPLKLYMPIAQNQIKAWQATLKHELGHTLGLADQYESQLYKDEDISIEKGSSRSHKTIMDNDSSISCDDADGLINLIDIQRHNSGGRRSRKPWKSLCMDSADWYLNGEITSPPRDSSGNNLSPRPALSPYVILHPPKSITWTLRHRYLSDTRTYQMALDTPIASLNEILNEPVRVTQEDAYGRPLRAVGKYQEEIYYDYFKEGIFRLGILKGKLIWATHSLPQEKVMMHKIYFGGKNRVSFIGWYRDKSNERGQALRYAEHIELPENKRTDIQINCPSLDVTSCEFSHIGPSPAWLKASSRKQAPAKSSLKDSPSKASSSAKHMEQHLEIQTQESMWRTTLLDILRTHPLDDASAF